MRAARDLADPLLAENGEPAQVIAPAGAAAPADARPPGLPAEAPEQEAGGGGRGARRPFDLAQRAGLRAAAAPAGATQEHLLLTGPPHRQRRLVAGVLSQEMGALYAASAAASRRRCPELPVQYADFAVWQRQWLQGEVLERSSPTGATQLAGLPVLQLPVDRPRPPNDLPGRQPPMVLGSEDTQRLNEVEPGQGRATLTMTLLAAFSILLSRYSGEEDVPMGSPIANRSRHESEGLIGFFANTLVLRTDLTGDPAFPALLDRVRQRTLEAYTHQDMPFEALVEALQPERSRNRNPLFQVVALGRGSHIASGGRRHSGHYGAGPARARACR